MKTKNGYEITDNITPKEYMDMRRIVGWGVFPLEQAAEGLKNSAVLCCVRDNGKLIGIGRTVSDHGYVVYIADVIVVPEYQGQGLGREIMEYLMEQIRLSLKPGYRVMVTLMAAQGKEKFYNKFGFIDRPNDHYGCGMHQWIEGQ